MSGTAGGYAAPATVIPSLPVPKVQLYKLSGILDVFVSAGGPVNGATQQVNVARNVKVTCPGIPHEVLSNLDLYQPRVELLRYTRVGSRENLLGGNCKRTSGYVHPSHGPGASGDGSFTHGGQHGGVDPAIQAIRPTEWKVTSGADVIEVTQGLLGFMCFGPINYRDNTGSSAQIDAVFPAAALLRKANPGHRFPYSRIMSPGYFEFRLSIKDPTDPRGKRIHGPSSTRVVCGNHVFPFLPAGVDGSGAAQADIANNYDPKLVGFWLGSTSRVPAQ